MTSYEVQITHLDGTTDTLTHIRHELTDEIGKQSLLVVIVPREEVNQITLEENDDEIILRDTTNAQDDFGGLLRDVDKQRGDEDTSVGVVVDSFERYARDAKPSGVRVRQNITDQTMVEEAINQVSELSQGTINQVESSVLTFRYNYASPAHQARNVESVTGGELYYNPDKTVDYVDSLGADKTGVTLSPANQNLSGVEVNRKGGGDRANHLLALGTARGSDQITTEVTASSFNSSTDRVKWTTETFKEIDSLIVLRTKAQNYIDEYNQEYVEVNGTAWDNVVNLGDEYTINYPEKDVNNQALRAIKTTRIVDDNGERYEVVFASRSNITEVNKTTENDVEAYSRKDGGYKGVNRRVFIEQKLATR